jgi:hypothetical protein
MHTSQVLLLLSALQLLLHLQQRPGRLVQAAAAALRLQEQQGILTG